MSRRSLISLGSLLVVAVFVAINSVGGFSNVARVVGTSTTAASQEAAVVYAIVPQEPVTLITEPDAGIEPVISRINDATSSVDMVMYELQDTDVEKALAAAAGRGESVRVILNGGLYGAGSSANKSAYTYLTAHGVAVRWSPSYFALTHQKTLITDDSDALIMTFNLTPQYYPTSRDFGVDDPDAHDVSAVENAFDADWNDTKTTAGTGDDLVWSPGSKPELLAMINSAKSSLLIYNEELQDPDIIAAIAAARTVRGVSVHIIMTDSTEWHSAFSQITAAGGEVRTYAANAPLYIHAKMIIADNTQAFIGSENFSTSSLTSNRELGLLISTPKTLTELVSVFQSDWNGATPFS